MAISQLLPIAISGASALLEGARASLVDGLSFAETLLNPQAPQTTQTSQTPHASSPSAEAEIQSLLEKISARVQRQAQAFGASLGEEFSLRPNGLGQLEISASQGDASLLEDLLNTDDALLQQVEQLQSLLRAQAEAAGQLGDGFSLGVASFRDFRIAISPQGAVLEQV